MRTYYKDFLIRDWETGDASKAGLLLPARLTAAEIISSALAQYNLSWEPAGADKDVLAVEECYLARGREFWVIERQHQLVGTGAYYPVERGEKAVEIRKMYLLPIVRRLGLGKFFLTELERAIKVRGFQQIWVETTSVLVEAVKLYENKSYQAATGVETARCDHVYVKFLLF